MSVLLYLYIITQLITFPYFALCAHSSFPIPARRQVLPEPLLDDAFAQWLENEGNLWGMKGVSIAITRRLKDENGNWAGWTSETKGYGVADRWGTPVGPDTLFSLGSNSKLFTALGVGLLTENKTLSIQWESKIRDILPENQWKLQDTIAQNHANLVDILSHRTGLPTNDLSYSRTEDLATAISNLRYLTPSAEFRDIFQYNNQMYFLAAHIIQQVTGIPFRQFISENIISLLNINSTTYNVTEAELSGRLADGFLSIGADQNAGQGQQKFLLKPIPFWETERDSDLIAGVGGVISTANDLVIWLQTLLLNGRHPVTNTTIIPESVISRAAVGVTTSLGLPLSGPELSPMVYGLGQIMYSYKGHSLIEHDGAALGHYSLVTRAPDDGIGIAILANADPLGNAILLNIINFRLLETALGLKHVDWSSRYLDTINGQTVTPVFKRSEIHIRSPLSSPIQDLAGAYFNPAYGTIILCDFQSQLASPSNSPTGCDKTVADVAEILHGPPPALVATWPKYWSTHILFYPYENNLFNVSEIAIYPPPFPNHPKNDNGSHPFAAEFGQAAANFILTSDVQLESQHVDGIAMTGIWGAASTVQPLSGTNKGSAEVWFDRVV